MQRILLDSPFLALKSSALVAENCIFHLVKVVKISLSCTTTQQCFSEKPKGTTLKNILSGIFFEKVSSR